MVDITSMTLNFHLPCKCCGQKSKVPVLMCAMADGSPDLDTRPPEEGRPWMWAWVFRCPQCGYCGSPLDERPDASNLNGVVQSPEYRAQLESESNPSKANEFLCQALIEQSRGRFLDAARTTLRAAWVCDDSPDHREQAIACRQSALSLLDRAKKARARSDFSKAVGRIRVDLMRRSGDLSGAQAAIESAMATADGRETQSILTYQRHLIEIVDMAAHTVSDAIDFVENANEGMAPRGMDS